MYRFVFFLLPLLTLAIPMAQSPSSHGISIPITEPNGAPPLDPVEVADEIERAAAKIQWGIAENQNNTGILHPFPHIINTSAKRDSGCRPIPLKYVGRFRLVGEISIGTSEQHVKVILDTGSTDLVVSSAYDPSTLSPSREIFAIFYGSRTTFAMGFKYTDSVTMADLTAKEQMLGHATKLVGFPKNVDGIMGLEFPEIPTLTRALAFNSPPTLQTLAKDRKLKSTKFGFKFGSRSDGSESEFCFDGLNELLIEGTMTWVTASHSENHWWMPISDIYVNDNPVEELKRIDGKINWMLDSGAFFITGHPTDIKYLYVHVPGAQAVAVGGEDGQFTYHIPCAPDQPPVKLSFAVGGRKFDIREDVFNVGNVPGQPGLCYGGAAASSKFKEGYMQIGLVGMQSFYTGFEFPAPGLADMPRIGFAELKTP